jgi:YegS/Rv2252/BmrU family lipid kinase
VRTCVIFNPVAKGNKARYFRAQLDEIARHAALKQTRHVGDAKTLAAEAVRDGFATIVAAGGDGTLNEVLNGIGEAGGFENCSLGVLPLGTVNVFARELRIPMKLESAWQIIRHGRERRIDLPFVEFGSGHGKQRRWFAQLAGAGLDSRAIELVNWRLKKKIGPLAYVWAGLKALMESKPRLSAAWAGGRLDGQLILIGNGRLYGGNFATFQEAQLDDGKLDVCAFERVDFWTLLRCAGPLLLSNRLPESVVRRMQTDEFTLSGPDSASFELDGELAGKLPVTFALVPRGLRVIVP